MKKGFDMPLIDIFCQIDDFCKEFEKQFNTRLLSNGNNSRKRKFKLSLSEVMQSLSIFTFLGIKHLKIII
jgi:hypothetical protein